MDRGAWWVQSVGLQSRTGLSMHALFQKLCSSSGNGFNVPFPDVYIEHMPFICPLGIVCFAF